jgi:TatD DNase family protein
MLQYIDTHIHLDGEEFASDRDSVVARAKASGVQTMLIPGINLSSVESIGDVCSHYPGFCLGMIGLHPEDVNSGYESQLSALHAHLLQPPFPVVAIGEIGLDYYWSRDFVKEQCEAFETQVEWGSEFNLPLMIHCRKAQNDMVSILKRHKEVRGIFHCFTGNEYEAKELLAFPGFCLGIGGVLTFKKSNLPQTLADAVPLERIVLETDAPYMAPVPHRGERNESAFIVHIIEKLAEVYQTTPEEVARITTDTAKSMFSL